MEKHLGKAQGWEHGQEGTHYVCDERLRKLGGKATCCGCDGHKCSDSEPAMEIEAQEAKKDCPRCKGTGKSPNYSVLGYPGYPCYYCLGTGVRPDMSDVQLSAPHPETQEALTHKDHIAQAEAATYADALVSAPHPEATQGGVSANSYPYT